MEASILGLAKSIYLYIYIYIYIRGKSDSHAATVKKKVTCIQRKLKTIHVARRRSTCKAELIRSWRMRERQNHLAPFHNITSNTGNKEGDVCTLLT